MRSIQDQLSLVFNSQIFTVCAHICVLILIVFGIQSSYQTWAVLQASKRDLANLSYLEADNQSTAEKSDYLNSDLFKSKIFKEEGYKEPGEVVVNIGINEANLKEGEAGYIPDEKEAQKSNFNYWWECLFSGRVENKSLNENKHLNCREREL